MKVGIVVDSMRLARWQVEALRQLRDVESFCVYDCRTPAPSRRRLRHLFYYVLNVFTVRNRLTRSVPLELSRPHTVFGFESGMEGAWQTLPEILLERIEQDRPAVILKFGMNLLRIPRQLRVPILSYHHGDPKRYRGRPAGFYELLEGADTMGQIVQILTEELDAGPVVACAESRIHRHSYKATLMEAYRISGFLLDLAVRNAVSGASLDSGTVGRLYRLPSNLLVLRFVFRMATAFARRLLYGAFFEKAWQVSTARALPAGPSGPAELPPPQAWKQVACPAGYAFLADPFYDRDGGLIVEALSARTRRGEILLMESGGVRRLFEAPYHVSYPGLIYEEGAAHCVPEMVESGAQRAFPVAAAGSAASGRELDVAGYPRLVDPTLFRHEGCLYLFANDFNDRAAALRLWVAESLFAPFREHATSPIRISPKGGRMGGAVLLWNGGLYRFGQDLTRDYGDGLCVFRIEALSPNRYRETLVGELRFRDRKGPHTLNFHGKDAVFDWYFNRLSLFAGLRRLRQSRV